jgi:hypothetical protein
VALRFFADHCISNQVVNAPRVAGHEVLRLKECMPTESPDGAVVAKAQELGARISAGTRSC